MASRYGRNKKRRHRERIAELESEVTRWRDSDAMGKKVIRDLDDKLREIIRRLKHVAPLSTLFAPKVARNFLPMWRVELLRDYLEPITFREDEPITPRQLDRTILDVPTSMVRAWVDTVARDGDFVTTLHAHVPQRDGTMGYAVSARAGDLMEPGVLEHMLQMLIADLRTKLPDPPNMLRDIAVPEPRVY